MAMAQQPKTTLSPPRPQLQRSNASAHPVLQGNNDYGAEGFGRGGMRHPRLPFMAIAEANSAPQSAGSTPLASPCVQRDNPMLRADSSSGISVARMPSRFEAMRSSPMDMFRSASSDTPAPRPTLRSKLSRKDLKEAAATAASGSRSATASPLPPTGYRSRSASTSSGKSGRIASSSSLNSSASTSSHASSNSVSKSRSSEGANDDDEAGGWIFKCSSTTQFDQQRARLLREKAGENAKKQQQGVDAIFLSLAQSHSYLMRGASEHGHGHSLDFDLASPTFRPEKPDDNHFLDFSQYICPLPSTTPPVPALSIPAGQAVSESLHGERTPRPTDYHRFAENGAESSRPAENTASLLAPSQACPVLLQPAPRERSFSASGRRPSLSHLQTNTSEGKRRSPPTNVQDLPCLPDWAKADNRLHQERVMAQSRSSSGSSDQQHSDMGSHSLRPAQMHRAITHDLGSLQTRDNPMLGVKQPFQRSHTLDVPGSEQAPQLGPIVVPRPQRAVARVSPPQSMHMSASASNETPRANRTQHWTHTPGNESFDSSSASDSGTSSDWSSVPQTPVSRIQGLHDAASIQGPPSLSVPRMPQSDSEIIDLFMASQGDKHDMNQFGMRKEEQSGLDQLPSWMRSADMSPSRETPRAEFQNSKGYPHFNASLNRRAQQAGPAEHTSGPLPQSTSRTSNASNSPAKSNKFLPSAVFNSQDSQLTVRGVGELIARTTTPQQRHVLGRPRAASSAANGNNGNGPTDYSKERDNFRAALHAVPLNEQGLPESPSRTSSLAKGLRRHRPTKSDARQSISDAASIKSDVSSHSMADSTVSSDAASIMSDASSSSSSRGPNTSGSMGSLLSYMRASPKTSRARAPSSAASSTAMSPSNSANGSMTSSRRLAAAIEERS